MDRSKYLADRWALEESVFTGAALPPPCFTCKGPSTHVTEHMTPAGYRAFQCEKHAPLEPEPLWGSDPGWQSYYVSIYSMQMAEMPKAIVADAEIEATLHNDGRQETLIEVWGIGRFPTVCYATSPDFAKELVKRWNAYET